MSWPLVHSDVAEPCQVSPPSSSNAPGRVAFSIFTSVARCAKPPTWPNARAALREIEIGECVRVARARRDSEVFQQVLADQVRRLAGGAPTPRLTLGSRK